MSISALIDTSVLIGGLPDDVLDHLEDYCSSTIVRAELMQGLHSFQSDPSVSAEKTTLRATLLENLDAIEGFWADFDIEASNSYGVLTARPKKAIRLKDALIAAHALALGIPVITYDKGFVRFPDVQIIVPEPFANR